jgi:hypothetical protein
MRVVRRRSAARRCHAETSTPASPPKPRAVAVLGFTGISRVVLNSRMIWAVVWRDPAVAGSMRIDAGFIEDF